MKIQLVGIAVGCLMLIGCEPLPVGAQRTDFKIEPLQSFPGSGNLTLNNVKLIMWPDNVAAETVLEVSRIAKAIDGHDDARFLLDAKKKQLETDKGLYHWVRLMETVEKKTIDLAKTEADKRDEEAKSAPNPKTLDRLTKKIAKLTAEKSDLETQRDEKGKELDPDGQLRGEYLDAHERFKQNLDAGIKKVDRLIRIVQYDQNKTKFTFNFLDDGVITLSIREMALDDPNGPRDFSTDDGTITNLSYAEFGGVFNFDVLAYEDLDGVNVLRDTYQFRKVGRARLDITAKDGRIFFMGDIIAIRSPEYCTLKFPQETYPAEFVECMKIRRGLAKFCDKNND